MFFNAARPPPRPLVARGRMSLSPQPSRPRARQFFCYNRQQPVVPSQRVLSPVSPAVLSVPQPTERNVFPRERQGHRPTVLLPAVAVEVKGPRRPSAPCGIWGDGTELDAVDDSNADPTLERQIHVQATGVHEGGTVKRFETEGKGKGRMTPVGTGTRITNANVGPSARAPANGTIDLAKFRESDVTKKREGKGEGEGEERERKPFIALHPPRAQWQTLAIGEGPPSQTQSLLVMRIQRSYS